MVGMQLILKIKMIKIKRLPSLPQAHLRLALPHVRPVVPVTN